MAKLTCDGFASLVEAAIPALPDLGSKFNGDWLRRSRCHDFSVGLLSELCSFTAFRYAEICRRDSPSRRRLIVVLESPHRDEYLAPDGPRPAFGRTGVAIRKRLAKSIEREHLDAGDFEVVLVNAIQFQCSLVSLLEGAGVSRRLQPFVRDQIFLRAWEEGGRDDFCMRLQAYFVKGDRVMNCCTQGVMKGARPLRDRVDDALTETLKDVQPIRRWHPAAWRKTGSWCEEWSPLTLHSTLQEI